MADTAEKEPDDLHTRRSTDGFTGYTKHPVRGCGRIIVTAPRARKAASTRTRQGERWPAPHRFGGGLCTASPCGAWPPGRRPPTIGGQQSRSPDPQDGPMDLFVTLRQEQAEREAPPRRPHVPPHPLDEFVGQDHVVGPGRLLRRAGPGRPALSRSSAAHPAPARRRWPWSSPTPRAFAVTLNAVPGRRRRHPRGSPAWPPVEDRDLYSRRTILLSTRCTAGTRPQQDAPLPWVENGTIIMIGATTENPGSR